VTAFRPGDRVVAAFDRLEGTIAGEVTTAFDLGARRFQVRVGTPPAARYHTFYDNELERRPLARVRIRRNASRTWGDMAHARCQMCPWVVTTPHTSLAHDLVRLHIQREHPELVEAR